MMIFVAGPALAAEVGEAVDLKLETGEVLKGVLVEETETEVVIDHEWLGRITIARDQLKKPPQPNPGLFGTSLLEGWRRRLSTGISGSEGITKKLNVLFRAEIDTQKERFRGDFDGRYIYESENKSKSENKSRVTYLHDLLFPETRFFLYGVGNWDTDEFEDWDHRLQGSGGVGLEIYKSDPFTVRGRMGPGFSTRIGDQDGTAAEGVANVQAIWLPIEGQEIRSSVTYRLDGTEFPEFLLNGKLDWTIALAYVQGLNLRLSALYEYDSKGAENNNDLDYTASIVYEF